MTTQSDGQEAGRPKPRSRQVVVVTGASAGVGRAISVAFAERGARIGLLARGAAGLAAASRDVEAAGGSALTLQVDVADPEAVEGATAQVEDELGPIDIWINNAMTSVFSPVRELQAAEVRRVTEVTYLGYVHGILSVLGRMESRGRGTIVNVGSALAFRGIPMQAAYCGAKHAIQGFTESLRSELLRAGSPIHIADIYLPAVNTPQFQWVRNRLPKRPQPVPPIFQPSVAADAVLLAVDQRRRHVWVTWSVLRTAIGNQLAPRVADRILARTGVEDQLTGEPSGDGPDNLWEPVDTDEDFGERGPFDSRAHRTSAWLWTSRNRGSLMAAAAGLTTGAALAGWLAVGSARDRGGSR